MLTNLLIKIKTPLWTGGVDQKSDSLQSTGIMGSLRWWFEAILRSMDKYACDIVRINYRCPKEESDKKKYCLSCLIFGATGMRRIFRLNIVDGGERLFNGDVINIKPFGRNRGWYLGSGIVGEIDFRVTPLDKDFDESLILIPLALAFNWGGIGAKTQLGYGVIELYVYHEIDFNKFKESIKKVSDVERLSKLEIKLRSENDAGLPNLKEMFFAKVKFEVTDDEWWKKVDGIVKRGQKSQRNYYEGYENDQRMIAWINSGSVPITPAIKNWLRYGDGANLWKTSDQNQNRIIENWLFGTIRNGKTSSKINISCAYKTNNNLWEFRIWGWIPTESLPQGFSKNDFLDKLIQALDGRGLEIPWNNLLGSKTGNHKLKVWREHNSSRDTVNPYESNVEDYLESLLKSEEGSV